MLTPTLTPTLTATPTETPITPSGPGATSTLFRAINLGGASVTLDGHRWHSYTEALADGLTVSPTVNSWTGTYPVALQPPPSAEARQIVQSAIWRTVSATGQGFQLQQVLPSGHYEVYVTMGENFRANYRSLDLRLEGYTAATGLADLPLGGWKRYGPFPVNVTDGVLSIDVVRGVRGDPHLMGLEIYAVASPTPTQVATETPSAATATPVAGTVAPTTAAATATVTPMPVPTATSGTPTAAPTATMPPTATPEPPTATVVLPTATSVPPTPAPPTATPTVAPPTPTSLPN